MTTAAFVPDATGAPRPVVLPTFCPAVVSGGHCRIGVHHWRGRKTGPEHPLPVLRCKPHHRAFTVYPLGHFPYGREAIAPVSGNGELLRPAGAGDGNGDGLSWDHTLFRAAFDAAEGRAWPRSSPARAERGPGPLCFWTAQLERLEEAARLLGIAARTSGPLLEGFAAQLGIPALTLADAQASWKSAEGFQQRGATLVSILEAIPRDRRLVDRLLACGVLSGRFQWIRRWDPGRTARCTPFPGRGIPDG